MAHLKMCSVNFSYIQRISMRQLLCINMEQLLNSLLKTLCPKDILLIICIFSFCHNVSKHKMCLYVGKDQDKINIYQQINLGIMVTGLKFYQMMKL